MRHHKAFLKLKDKISKTESMFFMFSQECGTYQYFYGCIRVLKEYELISTEEFWEIQDIIAKKYGDYKEKERPIEPERMDYMEKGAKIGKSRIKEKND